MLRTLLPPAEILLAAALVAGSCNLPRTDHGKDPLVVQGTVVDVRHKINSAGEPIVVLTVSTQQVGADGMIYDNETWEFPQGSREAALFGSRGRCVEVRHLLGGEPDLRPCE